MHLISNALPAVSHIKFYYFQIMKREKDIVKACEEYLRI